MSNKFVIFVVCIFCAAANADETLEIVHIIFRHGEKNPDVEYSYPDDPNINISYYPYDAGQLNTKGRQTMYELGQVLRERYDEFLGEIYSTKEVEAWSSPFVRNIFSLQVVMASLFPPKGLQRWRDHLNWQPTLFHYESNENDKIFRVMHNEKYLELYWETCRTDPSIQSMIQKYQTWMEYIEHYTGFNCNCTRNAFMLSSIFKTQIEANLTLPDWSEPIYPDILEELAIMEYHIQIYTKLLKRMVIGDFMFKILSDTEERIFGESEKKFYLYAAHETNIFQMMLVLGFVYPHVPHYGAYLALEVHKIEDQYVLKVFYKEDKNSTPKLLETGKGKNYIAFEEFKEIVEDIVSINFDGTDKNCSQKRTVIDYSFLILGLYLLFNQCNCFHI